jgi:hypothetical protein
VAAQEILAHNLQQQEEQRELAELDEYLEDQYAARFAEQSVMDEDKPPPSDHGDIPF